MARPETADVFRAIADPTRRGLLSLLVAGETPVGRLATSFDMSLPAISQHLRVLREVGLVAEHRVGRERRYRLQPASLKEVATWVTQFEQFWNLKLDALDRHLREQP